eukprot:2613883-Pyramimonas_sp.AAC.1
MEPVHHGAVYPSSSFVSRGYESVPCVLSSVRIVGAGAIQKRLPGRCHPIVLAGVNDGMGLVKREGGR